ASSVGGREEFAARKRSEDAGAPSRGVAAKLPYAGVSRIRFEGTVSIRPAPGAADTPASSTIRPRPPRRRQPRRARGSERQGHARDRAAEALVQAHRAVAAMLADVELEPVVAGVQAEVVGKAVFDQRIGPAQVAVVVVEVA